MNTVRELAERGMEYVGGMFTSNLVRGQEFSLNSKTFTVTTVTEKMVRLKCSDGQNIEARKMGDLIYDRVTRRSNPYEQFSRDLEGAIICDLVNEHNPFHKKSDVFQIVQAALNTMSEADGTTQPQYPRPRN